MDNFLITETELKLKVQICVVEPENYEKKESIFEKNDDEIYAKFVIPYNVGNDLIEPVFFIFIETFSLYSLGNYRRTFVFRNRRH